MQKTPVQALSCTLARGLHDRAAVLAYGNAYYQATGRVSNLMGTVYNQAL
jgi:hypothetical protein